VLPQQHHATGTGEIRKPAWQGESIPYAIIAALHKALLLKSLHSWALAPMSHSWTAPAAFLP